MLLLRKIAAGILLCALACGCTACGPGGRAEPYEAKYDGRLVPVKKSEVAAGKVRYQGILDLLARMEGQDSQPLAKSYVLSREESYREHWYRVVYYAYPRFGGEIGGPGEKKIRVYYKAQYKACRADKDFPWLKARAEIADSADEIIRYRLQVYAVTLTDDYVSVKFRRDSHSGGGKVLREVSADVFDRTTGEKLALGGVIDIAENAGAVNKAVADHLRVGDMRPREPYDVSAAPEQGFSVTEDGLLLLFAPGTLVSEAYGPIEVPIKWGKLR